MKIVRKISVRDTLRAMNVGDEVALSMREVGASTIRDASWKLGKASDMKFRISQNSKELTTYIKRVR